MTDYIFKRYGKRTHRPWLPIILSRVIHHPRAGQGTGSAQGRHRCYCRRAPRHRKTPPHAKHIFRYGKMIESFPTTSPSTLAASSSQSDPQLPHPPCSSCPRAFPLYTSTCTAQKTSAFTSTTCSSQRGLSHIKDAVELVRYNQGKAIDIHDVAAIKEDPKVKAQLRSGHCIGCFTSSHPPCAACSPSCGDNYVHLVAASSIIRPGVAKSGMMREYIQRFHKPDSYTYLHPFLKNTSCGETFGVMVYQEDVMKIVHHFAGLDMDGVRHPAAHHDGQEKTRYLPTATGKIFRNCKERGYSDELSMEVWRQVEFSGYSFCKAHSASFAVSRSRASTSKPITP